MHLKQPEDIATCLCSAHTTDFSLSLTASVGKSKVVDNAADTCRFRRQVYEAYYCNAMLLQVPALHSLIFAAAHLLQDCARALEATDFLGLRQNVNFKNFFPKILSNISNKVMVKDPNIS